MLVPIVTALKIKSKLKENNINHTQQCPLPQHQINKEHKYPYMYTYEKSPTPIHPFKKSAYFLVHLFLRKPHPPFKTSLICSRQTRIIVFISSAAITRQ